MKTSSLWFQFFLPLALLFSLAKPDPDPLQDYCIADTKTPPPFFTNGVLCINPNLATSSHFTTSALSKAGSTGNPFGFNVTATNTINLPGLNTMGLTMVRIDVAAKGGVVPLHSHPRASEVTVCLKGKLLVGFIDTSNKVFTQQLLPGDSFVFPKGLIHFLLNLEFNEQALAISGLNSQNPGTQVASLATFTSKPSIPDEVLMTAYQISHQDMIKIRKSLGG